jgi:hypothetical protein
MNDREKFLKNMALICDINDRKISEPLTDLYWKILEPFTDEECESAFKEIIQTCRFFPKPVDFMEILKGKKQDQATIAWIEVLNAVKRIGNYESVKFTDPVIHSVINMMGGWDQLAATMTTDEEKWKQKEFERLYEVISSRDGKHPEYLPGTHEQGNFTTGYEVETRIIEIGFQKKDRKLLN